MATARSPLSLPPPCRRGGAEQPRRDGKGRAAGGQDQGSGAARGRTRRRTWRGARFRPPRADSRAVAAGSVRIRSGLKLLGVEAIAAGHRRRPWSLSLSPSAARLHRPPRLPHATSQPHLSVSLLLSLSNPLHLSVGAGGRARVCAAARRIRLLHARRPSFRSWLPESRWWRRRVGLRLPAFSGGGDDRVRARLLHHALGG